MSNTLNVGSSRRLALLQGASLAGAAILTPACLAQTNAAAARPPRIVTISGAITEVVYELGAHAQLVGSDTTSIHPAAALLTPKVGYMRQLSAEGLLSLKPDAIIATTEAGPPVVLDQIRSAGVKVELIVADHSWGELQRKVQAVGRASTRETEARQLLQRLDADWASVQQLVAGHRASKPRVLFVLAPSAGGTASVSGLKTAANAMIGFAGGANCLTTFDGYRPLTAEAVIGAAPDVIVATRQGIDGAGGEERFWERPGLLLTPAGKRRALVPMETLYLLGFGPRLPQAVRELHQKITAT